MFNNIGKKIKTLSKVIAWIGIIASLLYGITVIVIGSATAKISGTIGASIISGVLIIIIGCLGSWIGSFLFYGFGELIDKTTEIAKWCQKKQVTNNDTRQVDYLTRVTSQLKSEYPRNNN